MSDYLDQLALRVQQPEFAVQPRPVSRFESPRHATLIAPEPLVLEEADEEGSPATVFMPAETSAGKPTRQADSHNHNASETVDSLSAARPTQESHKPSPGLATTVPLIATQAISPAATPQPLHEVAYPALSRQPAAQSGRIAQQAQPPVRIDTLEEQADLASSHPSERRELVELTARVVRGEREQVWPPVRIDRLEEQTDMASSDPLRRDLAEVKGAAVRGAREPIRPLVRIENPQDQWVSPLSTRDPFDGEVGTDRESPEAEPLFGRKADLMPKSDFAPMPEREIFKPLAEPTAPQLAAERVADAPTIQVTIGRVEIRATVEATPARKTPAKAPAMSLDEYLRQRNGGRG